MTAETDQTARDKAAILDLIERMKKARYDKNADAVAAQYVPDAAIYSLAPPLIHHGIDVAATKAWFDSWEGPVVIESRDFRVTVSGDIAFYHGYMRLAGHKKGADEPVSFWMRETLCLERDANTWRIVHEHASVPFYMDGSPRPAFDLQP